MHLTEPCGSETELHCLGLCRRALDWLCQVAVASISFTGKQTPNSWYCTVLATSVIKGQGLKLSVALTQVTVNHGFIPISSNKIDTSKTVHSAFRL